MSTTLIIDAVASIEENKNEIRVHEYKTVALRFFPPVGIFQTIPGYLCNLPICQQSSKPYAPLNM